jgi:hypothetical protein
MADAPALRYVLAMGIETVLLVVGVVLVVAVWGLARKGRRHPDSGHDSSPPRLSQR